MNSYETWWKWRDAVDQYSKQTASKQQEILDTVLNRTMNINSYYNDYTWAASKLIEQVDLPTSIKLLNSCLKDKKDDNIINLVKAVCKKGADQTVIRTMLSDINTGVSGKKALLSVNGLSVDEEESGLRAVATATHVPYALFDCKYSPSLDALKRLPPIMRLNTLEALSNRNHLSYNVFEKITDEEEFKTLLFSAATKYLDRVNNVWEKYQESMNKGVPGLVTVKYYCKDCGDIEIVVKSKHLHSKNAIMQSNIRAIISEWCPVCGETNMAPSVTGEIFK